MNFKLLERKILVGQTEFNFFSEHKIGKKIPILFLHGFTGESSDWFDVLENLPNKFSPILIDLPGHGKTTVFENPDYSLENIADNIFELLLILEVSKTFLVGYSFGGRVAYTFAAKYPKMIKSLVIESSTFGLKSDYEKQMRRKSDENLIEILQSKRIEEFTEFWINQPFFESQKSLPDGIRNKIRFKKNRNSNSELINSLKYAGTGTMNSVEEKLSEFNFPTLLISGELDSKYTKISNEAKEKMKFAEHRIIANCGHNTHLEKLEEFVILLTKFLEK